MKGEKSNTILRHALGKNKISDVVRVGEEEKKINFHFPLNLDYLTCYQSNGIW